MKIIKLTAENIKKLKAVEIKPEGNLVKITGKNAQGKTSVLDSILYALAGKSVIPDEPLRKGEDRGEIELDLGELLVKRTFTDKGTYLKVVTKEGSEYPAAQSKLSELVENISFDPLVFARMKSKERVEALKNVLGIKDELDELDDEYSELYDCRRMEKRTLKDVQIRTEKPTEERKEVEDITELMDRLTEEREKVATAKALREKIEGIEEKIIELEKKLEESRKDKEMLEKKVRGIKTNPDTIIELEQKIEKASAKQQIEYEWERYEENVEEAERLENKIQEIEKQMEKITEKKAEIIASVNLPIQGLEVKETVKYNGVNFDELSASEKLKISSMIAMELNPKLRVMRILDGSLLDEDNLKAIEELAQKYDFQVWLEIVDDSGEIGFYIEEGEIK